ncbi:hypothetical protein Ancab_014437 [Ancistrocladus abbreviatus]
MGSASDGITSTPSMQVQRPPLGAWRDRRSYKEAANSANAEAVNKEATKSANVEAAHKRSSDLNTTKCRANKLACSEHGTPELNRGAGDVPISSESLPRNDDCLNTWNSLRQSQRTFGSNTFRDKHVSSQGAMEGVTFMEDVTIVIKTGERHYLWDPLLEQERPSTETKIPRASEVSSAAPSSRPKLVLSRHVDRPGPSSQDAYGSSAGLSSWPISKHCLTANRVGPDIVDAHSGDLSDDICSTDGETPINKKKATTILLSVGRYAADHVHGEDCSLLFWATLSGLLCLDCCVVTSTFVFSVVCGVVLFNVRSILYAEVLRCNPRESVLLHPEQVMRQIEVLTDDSHCTSFVHHYLERFTIFIVNRKDAVVEEVYAGIEDDGLPRSSLESLGSTAPVIW